VAPGEPREFLEVREVRATKNGMAYWQLGSRHFGKDPDKSPTITLFGPGTLETVVDTDIPGGVRRARAHINRVVFPRPLQQGETARFGLVRRQAVEYSDLVARSGWRDQRDVTPVVPVHHLDFGVKFPAADRPSSVWHFEDMPEYLGPGAPNESNLLEPDDSGYVSFSWDGLMIGHSYGIAWRW
jgi:hypothetical protein